MYYKPNVDIYCIHTCKHTTHICFMYIHTHTHRVKEIFSRFSSLIRLPSLHISWFYSPSRMTAGSPVLSPGISETLQQVFTYPTIYAGHLLQDSSPITPGHLIMAFPAGHHSLIYLTMKCENLLSITQGTANIRLQFQQTL